MKILCGKERFQLSKLQICSAPTTKISSRLIYSHLDHVGISPQLTKLNKNLK
mgnify:CR=1 FL=1|jgi:hypothetical protein